MKKLLTLLLKKIGLQVQRIKKPVTHHYFRNIQMIRGFENLKNLDIDIKTIIDVGAAEGTWSLLAQEVWPSANFLLLEPLAERAKVLEELVEKNVGFNFLPYAAGDQKSTIQFYVADDLDGSGAADGIDHENIRIVKTTRIDTAVLNNNLSGPFLIKLDTHGFEIPILQGCEAILTQVSAFIIECYGFHITKNSLLLWEMCQYMDNLGYRLFNLIDITDRPKDNAFWQCDALFIKKEHKIFNTNTFN